jgi:hypothetical protein
LPRAESRRSPARISGISDGFRLAEPEPEAILDLALGAWDPDSDGVIIACLNFRSHPIIDALGRASANRSSPQPRRPYGMRCGSPA